MPIKLYICILAHHIPKRTIKTKKIRLTLQIPNILYYCANKLLARILLWFVGL
jgi:hypothetical protein